MECFKGPSQHRSTQETRWWMVWAGGRRMGPSGAQKLEDAPRPDDLFIVASRDPPTEPWSC